MTIFLCSLSFHGLQVLNSAIRVTLSTPLPVLEATRDADLNRRHDLAEDATLRAAIVDKDTLKCIALQVLSSVYRRISALRSFDEKFTRKHFDEDTEHTFFRE